MHTSRYSTHECSKIAAPGEETCHESVIRMDIEPGYHTSRVVRSGVTLETFVCANTIKVSHGNWPEREVHHGEYQSGQVEEGCCAGAECSVAVEIHARIKLH